uniref:Uncharacterized protein n=1 Tax=Anguilla anguilla TaxID=7936 RepID=A0A0E9S717_ANGAN
MHNSFTYKEYNLIKILKLKNE